MAEIPHEKPSHISRRNLFKAGGTAGIAAGALVAEQTGTLSKVEKILQAIAATGAGLVKKDEKTELEMPDLKFDLAEYFPGIVTLDLAPDEPYFRMAPDLNNYPIVHRRIKSIEGTLIDTQTTQLLVENPLFVEGMSTNRMDQEGSKMWFVLRAVLSVVPEGKSNFEDVPAWIFLNRSSNTAEYVHFPTRKPAFKPGYLDEQGNFVRTKVTAISSR